MTKTAATELTRVLGAFLAIDADVIVYADGHGGDPMRVDFVNVERGELSCIDEDGNTWYVRATDVLEAHVDNSAVSR